MTTSLEDATRVAGEALAAGTPRWEVVAVRYGTRMTSRASVYHNYERLGEPDGPLAMDYFFWLLRSDAGTILVDTGFDPGVGARRGRTTLVAPVEALERLGVAAGAVHLVVITHMHYDHIGNVRAFRDADLMVHERELVFWRGAGAQGEHAVHVEADEVQEVAGRNGLWILEGADLVAPGVAAILVGGHSPGQTALVVNGVGGPVLLTSDGVHYYEELEGRLRFAIFTELDELVSGYALLQALAERTGAVLVPGHDPAVVERFPAAGDELAGLALRIS
jgi:glyoxylase-like metal-dependent hydrolase (beta-lactamase superfamily II)